MSTLAEQEGLWMSGKHVGAAKPTLRAFVRRGHMERRYKNLPRKEVFSFIPGLLGPNAVWYGEWVPEEDYTEIPNLLSAKGDQDFEKKGVETLTLEIDNVVLDEQEGLAGIFHSIERGFMAPQRGDSGFNNLITGVQNAWHNVWKDQSTQIMVLAGYGEAFFPVFLGMLDDADLTTHPDRITVTARNMGKFLTDQHTYMDAKHLFIKDPITFCDRQHADELTDVARAAEAKSSNGSHPPRYALDNDDGSTWLSEGHNGPDELEWIEVHVPPSRIEDFQLLPAFGDLEMYVSVYATNKNVQGGGPARRTTGQNLGEGWISEGKGAVPGTTIPYTRKIGSIKEKTVRYGIRDSGGGYVVGDDSRVRLWFRNLKRVPAQRRWVYQAGIKTFEVYDRDRKEGAIKNHWILVDDVSDIVKTVLQWVGMKDWEIESVGARLKRPITFDRQSFLIDIIDHIAKLTSYVFYVKPPESFDVDDLSAENEANKSLGVAIFRQNNAMKETPLDRRYLVRDADLLTGIQPQFSGEPLAQSVRARGRLIKETNPGVGPSFSVQSGGAGMARYFYNYRPVWARGDNADAGHGAAGLRRHAVHYDDQITSNYEAKVACLFIAFRQALESAKAQIQIPFFPPIALDHQIGIFDAASGVSTRLWIASRQWEFRSGEDREFSMTLSGAMIDIDHVRETRQELQRALNDRGFDPAPIARGPWTEPHFFP